MLLSHNLCGAFLEAPAARCRDMGKSHSSCVAKQDYTKESIFVLAKQQMSTQLLRGPGGSSPDAQVVWRFLWPALMLRIFGLLGVFDYWCRA